MTILLRHIIPNLVLMFSIVYSWHILLKKKINFKSPKLYVVIFSMCLTSLLNYLFVNDFVRIALLTILFMFLIKLLFREKFQVCVITPIFSQLIIMISETVYAALLSIVTRIDTQLFLESFLGLIITNVSISILQILIIRLKFIQKIYNNILKFTDKIKQVHLLSLCLILILISNIFTTTIYYKIDYQYLILINCLLTLIVGFIIFNNFNTRNKYNKVFAKYNVAINSLKDYEKMMSKYKVSNHENKNLLLTVRAMIVNKETNIPKYIDSLIEDKYKDDEKLLIETSVIPTGGLRATIYSKILKIKSNNINYSLNIDKKINTKDLLELNESTIIDICKIIGVLIDNAIDEVKCLETKIIEISMYIENKYLNIKVSNNYTNNIEIDKIFDEGYTTKGKGHGYGLFLVRQIINNNKLLENKVQINKNAFSQILKIKI